MATFTPISKNSATLTPFVKNNVTVTPDTKTMGLNDFLLLEDGSYLLLEDGFKLILEESSPANISWTSITKN